MKIFLENKVDFILVIKWVRMNLFVNFILQAYWPIIIFEV